MKHILLLAVLFTTIPFASATTINWYDDTYLLYEQPTFYPSPFVQQYRQVTAISAIPQNNIGYARYTHPNIQNMHNLYSTRIAEQHHALIQYQSSRYNRAPQRYPYLASSQSLFY